MLATTHPLRQPAALPGPEQNRPCQPSPAHAPIPRSVDPAQAGSPIPTTPGATAHAPDRLRSQAHRPADDPAWAGIIGSQAVDHPGKLLIDDEDSRPDTQHLRFADRVLHAPDRHLSGNPTASRLLADPDDLLVVGTFDRYTGMVQVSNSEALEAWLAQAHNGTIPDLDTETHTTVAPNVDR